MPKKQRFSFKLSNRPGRFKIFERQGGEKLHIANVIVKTGLTESQAIRLIDLLNTKGEAIGSRTSNVMEMAQQFETQVKNEARRLINEAHGSINLQCYEQGVLELVNALLSIDGPLDDIRDEVMGNDTDGSQPKFPHPVLADVSEYLLKAEDRLNDLRDYDLDEDEFGVLDIETDVQSLVAKVQGILDAEEASTEEAARRDKNEKEIHYD